MDAIIAQTTPLSGDRIHQGLARRASQALSLESLSDSHCERMTVYALSDVCAKIDMILRT